MRDAGWVVGYHGCEAVVAARLLHGEAKFRISRNAYDWLGNGVYFWEGDADRALAFAQRKFGAKASRVVGAYLSLGHCLDLTTQYGIRLVCEAYAALVDIHAAAGEPLPINRLGPDRVLRYLDRAVINLARDLARRAGRRIDSVRGAFPEAGEAYPGAGFTTLNHIQLAILSPGRIKGVFHPLKAR